MSMPDVPVFVQILLGVGLLLAGRKLFWFFVGGVGFLAGFVLAEQYLPEQSGNMHLALAAILGLAGAALAYLAQKVALSVGGFLAGGFLGATVVRELLGPVEPVPIAIFLASGVAGLVLIHVIFDWALMLLSAVAGATVISQLLPLSDSAHLVVIAVLSAVGVAVQRGMVERKEKKRTPKESLKKESAPHLEQNVPEDPEAK